MNPDKLQRSAPRHAFPASDLDALTKALTHAPATQVPAPLMVTSVGRSGSTLLMRWLAAHPAIAADRTYPLESTFARECFQRVVDTLRTHPGGGAARIVESAHEAAAEAAGHYAQLHHRQGGNGTPRYYAEKNLSPEWLVHLICPAGKEIFLVRDPRDLICSSLAFNAKRGYAAFGRQDVASDLEYIHHRAAMARPWMVEAWHTRGSQALLVRYEDMIAAPAATLERILRYLDLEASDALVGTILADIEADEQLRAVHATSGSASRSIARWRTDLPPDLASACDEAFADFMDTFGYAQGDARTASGATPRRLQVLFSLDPYFDLNEPGIMAGWLQWFERLDGELAKACPGYAGRLLCFEASMPADAPSFGGRRHVFDQTTLRLGDALDGVPRHALDRLADDDPRVLALVKMIRNRCADFVPDVLILMSESRWLKLAFPGAASLNIEVSWLFRAPYPPFWSLDPCGWGKGRVLEEQTSLIDAHAVDTAGYAAITRFRAAALHAVSPSGAARDWVAGLRRNGQRIVLLPLAERFALDGRTPVFAALEPMFARAEPEEALYVLTEHPMDHALTPAERKHLARLPNVCFPPEGGGIDTQMLIPWVDAVVADFSSVSLQALLFDVEVVSLAPTLPYADPLFAHRNPLARITAGASQAQRNKLLHWLLTRYAIDETRLFDGRWLASLMFTAIDHRHVPDALFADALFSDEQLATHPWVVEHADVPAPVAAAHGDDVERRQYVLAEQLLESGAIAEAEQRLRALVNTGTALWEPYNDLASLLLQRGDTVSCIALLQQAATRETPPGLAHHNLAAVQLAAGQPRDALGTLGCLLRADPRNTDLLTAVRETINQTGQLDAVTWARLVADLRAGG